jgi:hypothetical protein
MGKLKSKFTHPTKLRGDIIPDSLMNSKQFSILEKFGFYILVIHLFGDWREYPLMTLQIPYYIPRAHGYPCSFFVRILELAETSRRSFFGFIDLHY